MRVAESIILDALTRGGCIKTFYRISSRQAGESATRINGVYLLRTNLDAAFDDNGQQTNPLTVRLTGNVTGIMKLLNRCGWQAEPESGASLPGHQFSLMARQRVPGKGD